MTVPDEIKWTTHRPVILAAPDWPEMAALKEHAASLGADVEVSPMVRSQHVNIVWVPKGFTGSAANATRDLHAELLSGTAGELAHWMGRLNATMVQAHTSLPRQGRPDAVGKDAERGTDHDAVSEAGTYEEWRVTGRPSSVTEVDGRALEPPSKVLLFSSEDLPIRPGTPADMLLGVPAVVDFEGVPHRVQSSPYVPVGQVYVIDEGAMQDAFDRALRERRAM